MSPFLFYLLERVASNFFSCGFGMDWDLWMDVLCFRDAFYDLRTLFVRTVIVSSCFVGYLDNLHDVILMRTMDIVLQHIFLYKI
jgi:hypothetical protein